MGARRPRTRGWRRLPAAGGFERTAGVQSGASSGPSMEAGEFARPVEFHEQLAERRDVVVAFDHGGHVAEELDGARVQIPYRRRDGVIVGVDQMAAFVAVSGQMKLADT